MDTYCTPLIIKQISFNPLQISKPLFKEMYMILRLALMLHLVLMLRIDAFTQEQLIINEFLASNLNWNADQFDEYDDWIEIHNSSEQPIDLAGYYITDNFSKLTKWKIPSGYTDSTTIAAGRYLILWADGQPEQGPLHLGFKLSKSGEEIALVGKDGDTILNSLSFGSQTPNISMGRYLTSWMYYDQPTPSAANLEGFWGVAVAPSFSEKASISTGSKTISLIKNDPNTIIRYTLDGSDPTETSTLYTETIFFDTTTIIRARAFKDNFIPSLIVSNSYVLNTSPNLPLLYIITDPPGLFNDSTGIYVKYGKRGMEWEREVTNQYFKDNELEFSIKSGIRIQGSTSRKMVKKSFRLYFRSGYGHERLEYDMFANSDVNSFENLVLRAGYDEDLTTTYGTLIRDPLVSELWYKMGELTSLGNFASLYINNDFWGIYNIRESINDHFFHDHLGYKDLDIIRYTKFGSVYDAELSYGTMDEWNKLNDFFTNNDFTQNSVYEEAKQRIDIENFTNLHALVQCTQYFSWGYGVFAVRERKPAAKWYWTIWDMDRAYTTYSWNEFARYNLTNSYWYYKILNQLLRNERYKAFFTNRLNDWLNTLFLKENVLSLIDSLTSIVEPEIPAEAERWNSTVDKWYNNIGLLRNFAKQRPAVVREQMVTFLNLNGQHNLTVDISPNKGEVQINSIKIKTFPWIGIYHEGVPITVKAVPAPGYVFTGWSDSTLPDSSTIHFDLKNNMNLTALFERKLPGEHYEIVTPNKMRSGEYLPIIVRLRSSNEKINTEVTKELSLNAQGALSDTLLKIKKGVGTLNPQLLNNNMFEIFVEDDQFQSEIKTIVVADSFPAQQYSGTLPEGIIIWDSTYDRHITAELTIPANTQLIIQPGTRIIVNNKVNVFVYGGFEVNGTKNAPVLFNSRNPDLPWGGFEFYSTAAKIKYCFWINGGGDSGKAWKHCAEYGIQPMLFAKDDSELNFDNVFILFSPTGKAIGSEYSKVNVTQCVISNVFHGGEFWYSRFHYKNSYILNIPNDDGIYEKDYDNDGMHIDYEYPGQDKLSVIENCFFISGKDDAIDHQNAYVEVKNTWLEDWIHEGVAASNEGTPISERNTISLFNVIAKGCDRGFEAGHGAPHLIIDHCIAIDNNEGIRFGDSYSSQSRGHITVTNTIAYNNTDNIRNYDPQQGITEGAIDILFSITNDSTYNAYPNCFAAVPLFDENFHLLPESPGAGMGMNGTNIGLIDSVIMETGPIVINEIMYNSSNDHDTKDWIELYNPQSVPQNVGTWFIKDNEEANSFTIPTGTVIDNDGYLVICSDSAALKQLHPEVNFIVGNFVFDFGKTDQVRLFAATEQLVDSIKYSSISPWPTSPNGTGPSLELTNYLSDNTLAENWQSSIFTGGTPSKKNSVVLDLEDQGQPIAASFVLKQNYPNPFNNRTIIEYVLPVQSKISLTIYNILGQKSAVLIDREWQKQGNYKLFYNPSNLTSGVYFCRLTAQNSRAEIKNFTRKILYLK